MPRTKTKTVPKYSLDNIHNVGEWMYYSAQSILMPRLLQQLLSNNFKKKLEYAICGGLLTKELETLITTIEAQGYSCIIKKSEDEFVFAQDKGYICVHYGKKEKTISMDTWAVDPKLIVFFKKLETDFVSKIKKNLVFSIIRTATGLDIKNLGNGHSPLIEENYNPKVLEDLNYVVETFKKDPPPGRIAILNGEPGTGKTHLIRSMLSQIDCVFLIIPSNMIDSLDKPEFLPLLTGVKEKHEKPIILIIEDGDVCLVPRRGDNISTIASLLNLSDGIVGSLIDIRVVISTNAFINEVDEAILRPGRLCKQIHVGPLPFDRANKVFQRLMADEKATLDYRKEYTLAEIYDRFNNRDSELVVHHTFTKRAIGFSSSAPPPNAIVNYHQHEDGGL